LEAIPAEMDRLVGDSGKGLIPDDLLGPRTAALKGERQELAQRAAELTTELARWDGEEGLIEGRPCWQRGSPAGSTPWTRAVGRRCPLVFAKSRTGSPSSTARPSRGDFHSVRALMDSIRPFLDTWDRREHLFVWGKTPA
jgi:hypothetical protein